MQQGDRDNAKILGRREKIIKTFRKLALEQSFISLIFKLFIAKIDVP